MISLISLAAAERLYAELQKKRREDEMRIRAAQVWCGGCGVLGMCMKRSRQGRVVRVSSLDAHQALARPRRATVLLGIVLRA